MTTATYTVSGMTCGHCVNAVTAEISQLPGVDGVQTSVRAGRTTVEVDPNACDVGQIIASVAEAGHTARLVQP